MGNKPTIWVINGPNLNMLGSRQPQIYGSKSLKEINNGLKQIADLNEISIEFFQSNHEGKLVEIIHSASNTEVAAFIINPGAFTHTSVAIRDAIQTFDERKFIEVHLSNIFTREKFRHFSYFSDIAQGIISGFGYQGYIFALNFLITQINGSSKT